MKKKQRSEGAGIQTEEDMMAKLSHWTEPTSEEGEEATERGRVNQAGTPKTPLHATAQREAAARRAISSRRPARGGASPYRPAPPRLTEDGAAPTLRFELSTNEAHSEGHGHCNSSAATRQRKADTEQPGGCSRDMAAATWAMATAVETQLRRQPRRDQKT